jgi:hypothetical protein
MDDASVCHAVLELLMLAAGIAALRRLEGGREAIAVRRRLTSEVELSVATFLPRRWAAAEVGVE